MSSASDSQRNVSRSPRYLIYVLMSLVANGVVAGLAGCTTYGSSDGSFSECFALYAIPIPMAFGMVKVPTILVGLFILSRIPVARAGHWALVFLCIFVVGLLGHLGFALAGSRDSWAWFGMITVDFGIISLLLDSMRKPLTT